MESYNYDTDNGEERATVEEGGLDSSEEAFMRGYDNEEKIKECPECGVSIEEDEGIIIKIDDGKVTFCSKICAQDYQEGMKE